MPIYRIFSGRKTHKMDKAPVICVDWTGEERECGIGSQLVFSGMDDVDTGGTL